MGRSTVYLLLVGVIFAFLISIGIVVLVRDPVILPAATLGMAVATVWVAIVALISMYQGHKQATEALYALSRPILVPKGQWLDETKGSPNDTADFESAQAEFWSARRHEIEVENVGTGAALNVWGALLPPYERGTNLPHQFFVRWRAPIKQGETVRAQFNCGGFILHCGDKIGEHSLCVPREYAPRRELRDLTDRTPRYRMRLTLTYSDVFGRRHASIFDYSTADTWSHVDFLKDIPQRLDEMDRERGRVQPIQSGGTAHVTQADHPAHDDLAELGL